MTRINEDEFLDIVRKELAKARKKFPKTTYATIALMEEVGELAQAQLKAKAGIGRSSDIILEAAQVIVMAIRIVTEGDLSLEQNLEYKE